MIQFFKDLDLDKKNGEIETIHWVKPFLAF